MAPKKAAAEIQAPEAEPEGAEDQPQEEAKPAEGATAQQPLLYSPTDKDTNLVDRLRARHMPSGRSALDAGEIIKRRKVTFELDGVECEPDMFVNESGEYISFSVTLRSLTSAQEIEAMRGAKDGAMAPMLLCRQSLFAINEKPLSTTDRDFFWECFGASGRQICLMAFESLGAASRAALGKFLSTRSESS